MFTYSAALERYLATDGRTQAKLAAAVGKTQVAVSRYASGSRFPDLSTAREIDSATGGEVPIELWQAEAVRRVGIEMPARASEAA